MLKSKDVDIEIEQIVDFIKDNFDNKQKAIIPVSGGLDSDVVTRLVYKALGKKRVKLFIIIQSDMEKSHIKNAKKLAKDLNLKLIKIKLKEIPYKIISEIQRRDKAEGFNKKGLLDIGRTKVALRTVINSIYQDKGYRVIGTSNKTEIELGFFLPFGDGIAHLKPIAHLYKTEVFKIARKLNVRKEVLTQAPSAGLWRGEKDLEDISYWIYNEAPIQREIDFTQEDIKKIEKIYSQLSIKKIDKVLKMLNEHKSVKYITDKIKLDKLIIKKIKKLVNNSKKIKGENFNISL